jgi:hypothetical protein
MGAIWLVGAVCDRIWLALDRSVPSWDPTNHLTGSLNYLNALQQMATPLDTLIQVSAPTLHCHRSISNVVWHWPRASASG